MRCLIFRHRIPAEAREICPGVPALIITGYAEAEAISDRAEDVEVLQKPFTANSLENAIRGIVATAPHGLSEPVPAKPN